MVRHNSKSKSSIKFRVFAKLTVISLQFGKDSAAVTGGLVKQREQRAEEGSSGEQRRPASMWLVRQRSDRPSVKERQHWRGTRGGRQRAVVGGEERQTQEIGRRKEGGAARVTGRGGGWSRAPCL